MRLAGGQHRPLRLVRAIDVPLAVIEGHRGLTELSTMAELKYIYGDDGANDWLHHSSGISYPALIAAAHEVLGREGLLEGVRTVVLALATPDSQHSRLLGGFTNELFATRPNTFAVTEQGSAGPFTSLILAGHELDAMDEDARALVLVLEQATLPPADAPRPTADRAVALLVSRGERGRAIDGIEVSRHLDQNVPESGAGDAQVRIVGRDVDDAAALRPGRATVSTGVWEVLARIDAVGGSSGRPISILEIDRHLGYRCELRLGAAADGDAIAAGAISTMEVPA